MLTQSHWIVLSTKNYTIWINDFKINIQKLIVTGIKMDQFFRERFACIFIFLTSSEPGEDEVKKGTIQP